MLFLVPCLLIAQDTSESDPKNKNVALADQLNELSEQIERKSKLRDELDSTLSGLEKGARPNDEKRLNTTARDIEKLKESFQLLMLGNSELSSLNSIQTKDTTWQEDVLEIVQPLMESLKSITKRPREIANLREQLNLIDRKLKAIDAALTSVSTLSMANLNDNASNQIQLHTEEWINQQVELRQDKRIVSAQLTNLTSDEHSFINGIWPAVKRFILGRGLTILIATGVAILTWGMMRLMWSLYTSKFTSKNLRRNSTWYRVISYSYYMITIVVVVITVLAVLYMREDLLLLALAFLLLAGAALSFRHFLPRYVGEARLLMNLGSVREDERVIYNGLPWQVMSINLYTVLHNPDLDGIVRLPLSAVSSLNSRPVKNKLWFPTRSKDYVILPDGLLGQIKHQTPDLVEVNIRGGMSVTFTTSDFYKLNIINLSRADTFGVSITFGLDYCLQSISLTEIPNAIHNAVNDSLIKMGYEKNLMGLVVELSSANTSSLDFLVFVTLNSEVAKDYYKIERLLSQTCVAVSNSHGWTIPFPQLTVHQSEK